MSILEKYKDLILSVEEAASFVSDGDVIFAGGFGCLPVELLNTICKRNDLRNISILTSNNAQETTCLVDEAQFEKVDYSTVFMGSKERETFLEGNVKYIPVNLHNSVRAALDIYKANVFTMDVSEPDEDGYISIGMGGGGWRTIFENCEKIIFQINSNQISLPDAETKVHISDVTAVCRFDSPLCNAGQTPGNEISNTIASHIIPMIPDGATLQVGIGAVSNAVAYGLENHHDLRIHTEIMTESLAYLIKCGAIKKGHAVSAFGIAHDSVRSCAVRGDVRFLPVDYINNPYIAGQNPNLISINSCLMTDLTGQVCSESIGPRQYSGSGGQLDFVRAAAISKGGKSFLCMPSTHIDANGKTSSNIMLWLPQGAVVTTPRTDVMYIVTEYGCADLFCRSMEERATALIRIAHPDFREELFTQALSAKLIRPKMAEHLLSQIFP